MLLRVASWLARINNGLRPLSRRGIGASLFRQPVTGCRPDYQRRAVEAVTVAGFEPLPLHPDPKFEGKFGKIVGGVRIPPCGTPVIVGFHVPSSTVPAFSQRRMVVVNAGSRANKGWCPRLSKQPEMSASSNHALAPAGASVACRATIASIVHRPGRNP